MGARGPRRQPAQLRALRTGKAAKPAPVPRAAEPVAPPWLSDAQRVIWRRVAEDLAVMGLWRSADTDVLVSYVVVAGMRDDAGDRLLGRGVRPGGVVLRARPPGAVTGGRHRGCPR
jgi:hypothetical protein